MHDGDQVGHRRRLGLIVRDVDRRRREPLLQPLQLAAHRRAQLRVEVRQRLVHQERLGIADDRAGERDALPLAARELLRAAVQQMPDLEELRDVAHRPSPLGLLDVTEPERVGDVLRDGHVRVERVALEHHRDVAVARLQPRDVALAQQHLAAVGELEPREDAERRRLAAAGWAEHDEECAVGDGEVERAQRVDFAEPLRDGAVLDATHETASSASASDNTRAASPTLASGGTSRSSYSIETTPS